MAENKKPKATVKRPSIFKELVTYAIKEEIEPKSTEIMHNVITGVIDMFGDAARKSVDKWMYPDGNAPVSRHTNKTNGAVNTNATNYSVRVYNSTGNSSPRRDNPKPSIGQRSSLDVQLVWVDDVEDAEEIKNSLYELIDNYQKAKVADYYETVNRVCNTDIATTMADFKYGWTEKDRPNIGYYRDKGKYYISLPKPSNIEHIN
jgi:hypothetical protein